MLVDVGTSLLCIILPKFSPWNLEIQTFQKYKTIDYIERYNFRNNVSELYEYEFFRSCLEDYQKLRKLCKPFWASVSPVFKRRGSGQGNLTPLTQQSHLAIYYLVTDFLALLVIHH